MNLILQLPKLTGAPLTTVEGDHLLMCSASKDILKAMLIPENLKGWQERCQKSSVPKSFVGK